MNTKLTSTLTVLTLSAFAASAAPITGPILNPGNGHIYYMLGQNTWTASEAEALGLGGHLVTINDVAENNWVFDTFNPLAPGNFGLWIGLNDVAVEGSFVWIDGDPSPFRNWGPGEPNNSGPFGVEDYTHMVTVPGGQLQERHWNDVSNLEPNRFGVVEVVPEPSSLVLLLSSVVLCLRRRMRCNHGRSA